MLKKIKVACFANILFFCLIATSLSCASEPSLDEVLSEYRSKTQAVKKYLIEKITQKVTLKIGETAGLPVVCLDKDGRDRDLVEYERDYEPVFKRSSDGDLKATFKIGKGFFRKKKDGVPGVLRPGMGMPLILRSALGGYEPAISFLCHRAKELYDLES